MTISVTSSDSNNKKIKINKELLMRPAPLLSLIILVIFLVLVRHFSLTLKTS